MPPLPTTELAVIEQILAAPGFTVTELSKRLGMRQSNVGYPTPGTTPRGWISGRSL